MNEQKGLFNKYTIINNETGKEVEGSYFVLNPETDLAAIDALIAYAKSTQNKELAKDIYRWLDLLGKGVGATYKLIGGTIEVEVIGLSDWTVNGVRSDNGKTETFPIHYFLQNFKQVREREEG